MTSCAKLEPSAFCVEVDMTVGSRPPKERIFGSLKLACLGLLWLVGGVQFGYGQSDSASVPAERPIAATNRLPSDSASVEWASVVPDQAAIQQQIRELSHPSFRTRQLARWRLEQTPELAIEAIDACLGQVEYNTGAQLVDVLSALATQTDVTISLQARETLQKHANRVSAVGRMADNAMRAIADLQEEQALQILTHHGARFGPSNLLGIVLNGQIPRNDPDFALWIDDSFTGGDEAVVWIQFLKSIDTVYFQGPNIGAGHFRAISKLPDIKRLKCKNVKLSVDDLTRLKGFTWLKLLELAYVDIDDSYLNVLAELPISDTLRLFGTRISAAGAERLARQLDGIEIYCARGGHLGIATHPSNTIITEVKPNTGAQRAGIMELDRLTHVDGVAISNMSELRAELAKHSASESVQITLIREPLPGTSEEHTLTVTLTEDPN
jgi:hypothetical protein